MAIKHRVESLEKLAGHGDIIRKVYLVFSSIDESETQAKQRYCEENNMVFDDLEGQPEVMAIFITPLTA